MTRGRKRFDAVEMMRSIRDEMSEKIKDMTLEEELAWLASQDLGDPFLTRLREKTAQRPVSTDNAKRCGMAANR
jgi:hypothetical protein